MTMVRVISVHHFSRQDVASVAPPLDATITNDNLLLIATDSLQVEVRDLKKAASLSHCFQTIDQVSELLYSPVGSYVATLEGNRGKKGASVRVYVNWDDPKVERAPLRPRIASRVTPSMQSQEITLDMIEFPQRDSPLQIAVCPGTGNLVVAATNVMVIYKYVLKMQETSKTKYVDFEDRVHIFHNFLPKEISLVESVVACLSDNEVHVFRLKLVDASDDEQNLRSCSVYSFSSESESISVEPGSMHGHQRNSDESDTGVQAQPPVENVQKIKTNVTAKRQQDSEVNETHLEGYGGNVRLHTNHVAFGQGFGAKKIILPDIEKADREYFSIGPPKIMDQTLGPCTPPGGCRGSGCEIIVKLVPTSDQDVSAEAEAITLVHCKLLASEEEHEIFQNLTLKPVYWKEFRVRKKGDLYHPAKNGGSLHPLQSAYHPHLMALTLCFTSLNEGFLYHLPGHMRKPGRGCGVQKIATYPFTSPVSKIALEPTLLHALTQTGLETYTLRSGYSTVMEAESINGRTNACPSSQTPICLVGLRPFLGAKHLVVGGNYLVLLASADDPSFSGIKGPSMEDPDSSVDHKKWTIYSLQLPTPITLHKDMTELANMNRTLSPHGYLQLICEAHVVLRTAYHQLAWQCAVSPSPELEKELEEMRQKYLETCTTLGNYYVMSDCSDEWKLALPYYRISQQSVYKILTQAKALWMNQGEESKEGTWVQIPPGLLHYMVEVILNPVPGEDVLEASLADLIIDLLGEYALQTLAQVVLKSPTFRDFKASKIYNYLRGHVERRPRPDAEEVVAFALLCVDRAAGEEARSPLQSLAPIHLAEIVLAYYDFLLDQAGGREPTFSEFALLLRDTVPETFVEILVSLIKANIFPLSTILHLFIESFVSVSNNSGNGADLSVHHASTLQLFLEAYFTETLSESELNLDPDGTRALQTLIRSYLTSLSVPVRFGERNIDSNMFGSRPLYLDQLSPFDCASDPAEKAILNTDSPDFWCQNSLLKLQSLLLSPLCKSPSTGTLSDSFRDIVLSYLDMKEQTIGSLSLRLLCVLDDVKASISLLVENKPDVVLAFANEHKLDLEGWKSVLRCLQDQVNDRPNDHPLHEVWYTAMQEVLDHLAQTLLLEAFLEVLPEPHNSEDFQAYVQICRKNQQAHQIQKLIVTTGHDMLNRLPQVV